MKIKDNAPLPSLFIISFLFLVMIPVVSCGKQGTDWTGTIEEADGITVVKNPEGPRYSESILALEEELSIGEAEGREEYVFSRLRDVEVDEFGRIYALDGREANVKVFGRDGNYLGTIGKKGQGPGEFQIPNDIYVDGRNRIYISDVENDRLSTFNEEGSFVNSFHFKEYSISKIIGANSQSEIILLMNKPSIDTEGNLIVFDYVVNVYSPRFELLESLYRCPIPVMQMFAKEGRKLSLSIPYQKALCCEMDSHGLVYLAESQEYRVCVFNFEGTLIRRIEKACERSKVSRRDVENYVQEQFQEDDNERTFWFDTVKDELRTSDDRPVIGKLFFDQQKLMVLKHGADEKGNICVDIFDSEGKYVGTALLNVLPRSWKNNKIYAIEEDESGFQYVKCYTVHWKL